MKRIGIGTTSLSICAALGLLSAAIACSSGDANPDEGGKGGSGTGNTGNTASGGSGNTGNTGGSGNTGNTGTGGSSGSGNTGNTGGSSGGTGGGSTGASVCDDSTAALLADQGYVDNFETDVRFLGWYGFADDGAAEPHNGTRDPGGALETTTALHVSATGITPPTGGGYGAGFGFNNDPDPAIAACVDISAFDGISFWAKGTSGTDQVLTFQVVHPATAPVADGGDCTVMAQCYLHPKSAITLAEDPAEWTQYTIAWSDLSGSTAMVTGPILGFNLITAGAAYDVWIDEVTLYSGTAPTGPVGPPDVGAGGAGAGGAGG